MTLGEFRAITQACSDSTEVVMVGRSGLPQPVRLVLAVGMVKEGPAPEQVRFYKQGEPGVLMADAIHALRLT